MPLPILRPYQQDLTGAVQSAWAQGAQNVLMRLDTGGGKTVILSWLILHHKGASCVMAHRNELVGQLSAALARNGVRHNIIAAKDMVAAICKDHVEKFGAVFYDPGAPCTVASVDTLIRRKDIAAWCAQVTLWIVDEAHHLVEENKWHRAIALFTHPQCRGLGPTATPARADGKGLGRQADGFMDIMVEGPPMRWLIEQGYLSEYKLICPPGDLEMIEEVGASGDWSTVQLRKAAKKSHIVGNVVDAYLKYGAGKLGITFATDVETAGEMTLAYRAKGVRAETLTGETDPTWRRNMLKMYEARQLDQIVAVDIVSEGFDMPAIEVGSLARPTASLPLYMQQFGRVLRILKGKEYALIIDHVGNTVRHGGAPDKPRPWTLNRRDKKSRGATIDGVRVCVGEPPLTIGCLQPYERFRTECPYCGTPVPEPAGRSSPSQVDGDLIMLDADALAILRGQVEQADMHPSTYGLQLIAAGMPGIGATANQKRHAAKQEAQAPLRQAMGEFGAVLYYRGFSDREMQRAFFLTFGTDVLSAQGLGIEDAEALERRIRNELAAGCPSYQRA